MIHSGIRIWIALLAALPPLRTVPAQTQFFPLGYLDGSGPASEANAVTPDGSRIAGYSTTSLTENLACWWTASGIEVVPGTQNWLANAAYGISADGNVIVGDRSFGGTEEAWYWTPSGQTQLIPFPAPQRAATARGVSGDGQVIVGTATSPNTLQWKAFRRFDGIAAKRPRVFCRPMLRVRFPMAGPTPSATTAGVW
ncbi:MAG TPA: hypothetical protein VMN36_16580 [Verrucomicrobiales bacterium]|nr:hypothetical protein [Verrucomicrobiales bacterium]